MLILASASPRRAQLLTQAGFTFVVEPANINEDALPGESAAAYVQRLAVEKAQAICKLHANDSEPVTVLAADTAVVLVPAPAEGTDILGKPLNPEDAARMLALLSGRTHAVMTGLAAISSAPNSKLVSDVEITHVTMDLITEREIEAYIATGEPLDKAGAYAIQGYAARWIPRIEGDYFNVVGLPIARTVALLQEAESSSASTPNR